MHVVPRWIVELCSSLAEQELLALACTVLLTRGVK